MSSIFSEKYSIFGYGLKHRFWVLVLTLIFAGIGGFAGFLLGKSFGNPKMFAGVGIFLSYFACQFFLYKYFVKFQSGQKTKEGKPL